MLISRVLFSKQKLDFVILGATGFTGRYVVQQMLRTLLKNNVHKNWGIAGRDTKRLNNVLNECRQQNPTEFPTVDVIEVDINDSDSLLRMCGNTSLIVNCCGPYRLLGEQVVTACIKSGCHHIDVSGEPYYLENIQHKYNNQAVQQKVSIIGSCGFDSVPSDLGVQFLKSNFDGILNSVETYLRVETKSSKPVTYNFATWHSLVFGYAFRQQLTQLRQQLYSQFKRYQWKHPIKRKNISKDNFGYSVPFPGSDRSVVSRTQIYNYSNFNERPVQIETYFTVPSLMSLLALFFVNTSVTLLSPHPRGRDLLMKYPNIFSFGVFNRQTQPNRQTLELNSFEILFVGKGWSKRPIDSNEEPKEKPNKTVMAKISGGDLAYLDTSIIVTQITLLLLDLMKQKRLKFGVLTPSLAFSDSPLIERLNENGIKFEIIGENK